MRAYLKSIDVFLLFFLTFFTIDKVIAKPLMIIFGLIWIGKNLKFKEIKNAPLFYIFICVWGLINFLFINTDFSLPHIIAFSIGVLYWLMGICAFIIIKNRIETKSLITIEKTIDAFFYINLFWTAYNLFLVMFKSHSINPYSLSDLDYGNSTGDYLKGLLMGPSYLNMMINALFCIYYLFNSKYLLAITATIIACMTTSNFANIIFILMLFVCFILLKQTKARITIIAQLAFYVIFYVFISNNNLTYIMDSMHIKRVHANENTLISNVIDDSVNVKRGTWFLKYGKTNAVFQTYNYILSSPKNFIFGAGIGEFSSQLAVRTSDLPDTVIKKSRIFKIIPTYVAPPFKENNYQIFSYVYSLPPIYHSIKDLPISFVNQILGEYGIGGLILFLIFYLFYFIKNYKDGNYLLPMVFLISYFLLFDYLFEYLSVIVFFEIFFLLNKKKQNLTLSLPK